MEQILYEVVWSNDGIGDYMVVPVTMIRRDILPDATRESITVIASDGNKYIAKYTDYYETELEAWTDIQKQASISLESTKEEIERLNADALFMAKCIDHANIKIMKLEYQNTQPEKV